MGIIFIINPGSAPAFMTAEATEKSLHDCKISTHLYFGQSLHKLYTTLGKKGVASSAGTR